MNAEIIDFCEGTRWQVFRKLLSLFKLIYFCNERCKIGQCTPNPKGTYNRAIECFDQTDESDIGII